MGGDITPAIAFPEFLCAPSFAERRWSFFS